MTTIIHIDPDLPLHVLDEHGWTQGSFESGDGKVCAHGAIRLCAPVPGDAYLIEQVEGRLGRHSTGWNDNDSTTEADVRAWFAQGIDIADADLEATFGPQWRAVVSLVRRAAILTSDDVERLYAVSTASRDAAWDAARNASSTASRYAAGDAARDAAGDAARDAAWAIVTYDLATPDGPYTIEHRDLLLAPWIEVCGMPEGLVS
jgi:hypothetical protein